MKTRGGEKIEGTGTSVGFQAKKHHKGLEPTKTVMKGTVGGGLQELVCTRGGDDRQVFGPWIRKKEKITFYDSSDSVEDIGATIEGKRTDEYRL